MTDEACPPPKARAGRSLAMVKVLILFGEPTDVDLFASHFEQTHRALLSDIPELSGIEICHVAGVLTGDSPCHLVVQLQFPSEEAMRDGLNSEPGQRMARDFSNFATGGLSILLCRTYEEEIQVVH